MIRRFRLFAESLLLQASKHHLSGELVVVEWNPPPGPRLSELLDIEIRSDSFPVRFIEVPQAAHCSIRNSDVIPLFQMIAKNVGIRRAKGDFIIATNPDLLFSDSLISFLASGALRSDITYRIDRHDVPADPPENALMDEFLEDWCARNVLRIHKRWGTFTPLRRWKDILESSPRNNDPTGDGYFADFAQFCRHLCYWSFYLLGKTLRAGAKYLDPLPKVHTNGCGDFTMLSRRAWFELRGYPELPLWSMHLDSLLCYMAVASGIREELLKAPKRMFHLEHENSWVVMSPENRVRTFATKPWLDRDLLAEVWTSMYYEHRPVKFNDENWGLAALPLNEIFITRAGRESIGGRVSSWAAAGR